MTQYHCTVTSITVVTRFMDSLRFETLEQNCRKDLDALQNALTHSDPVPKYHYETKQYSTVR